MHSEGSGLSWPRAVDDRDRTISQGCLLVIPNSNTVKSVAGRSLGAAVKGPPELLRLAREGERVAWWLRALDQRELLSAAAPGLTHCQAAAECCSRDAEPASALMAT